jgi:hypothetical protein
MKLSKRTVIPAAIVLAVVLDVLAGPMMAAAQDSKNNNQAFAQTYLHTYDDAFEAALVTIERIGWFPNDSVKGKGVITGTAGENPLGGTRWNCKGSFELLVESVSAKPETRVTISIDLQGGGFCKDIRDDVASYYFSQLAKVLSTYR